MNAMAQLRAGLFFQIVLVSMSVTAPVHAGVEQVWQYTVSTIPNQVFNTLQQAEAAMWQRGNGAQLMTLSRESMTDVRIYRYYAVEPIAPEHGEWAYVNEYSPSSCLGTESAAVQKMVDINTRNGADVGPSPAPMCSYAWVPVGNWSPSTFVASTSWCGHDRHTLEVQLKDYDVEDSNRYWTSDGNPPDPDEKCTAVTRGAGMYIHRVRQWWCPQSGYTLKAMGSLVGFSCVNNNVATITGALAQYQSCTEGNPCSPANGDKSQVEVDIPGALSFSRTYHSINQLETRSYLGNAWFHSFSAHLLIEYGGVTGAVRASGYAEPLKKRPNTTNYVAYTGSGIQVEAGGSGWILYETDGSQEHFDATGRLLKRVDPAGRETRLVYDQYGIVQVVGPFGETLTFNYDADHERITSVASSSGQVVAYGYQGDNLVSVTYPGGATRTYHYEDARFPNHLTGITDENGNRYGTYSYDNLGRAVQSEHAGGYERITLQYNADGTTTVTDAGGTTKSYQFLVNGLGIRKPTGITLDGKKTAFTYVYPSDNPQRRVSSRTDGLGRKTSYTYDTHHLISKVEVDGTALKRTTTYQYLSEYNNLPTLIKSPSVYGTALKEIQIAYSGQLPAQITQRGFAPDGSAVSRSVTMQYNALGQVTQFDGPRTEVNDVTQYAYYANTVAEGNNRGQLKSVTNALGHVTRFDAYDAAGRVLQMTSPNGVTTTYTYDARGRVLSVTQTPTTGAQRITSYQYDGVGQLTQATLPNGATLSYTYNAAHLLTSVTDALGNRVDYGYDLKGNRTSEKTYDSSNTLVRNITLAYDARNNLATINTAGSVTQRVFDAVSNLTQETDPNTDAPTQNTYDALDRLTKSINSLGGATDYSYNVQDRLTQVKAPNGAATQYIYDDLGNLLKEVSPDRGTTTYSYDSAGNLLSKTDARGITVNYTYDALNRVVNADYPGTLDDVYNTYDTCAHGVGKLCRIQDGAGITDYAYEAYGNVARDTRTELGQQYVIDYRYDANDRLVGIVYPSGRDLNLARDAVGRITSVTATFNGESANVASAITYRADGLLTGLTYGNGRVESRAYDLQGRVTQQTLSTQTRSYAHDANGNILSRSVDAVTHSYSYDALDRLTGDDGTTYTYDANGNRLNKVSGGSTTSGTYTPYTNRLAVQGGNSINTDAAGNILGDNRYTFTVNNANRIVAVYDQGILAATYVYNALGQRTRKITSTATTVYHYDLNGQLLAETDANGAPIREYLWNEQSPLAQIDFTPTNETIAYLHTDHLATPRSATDETGAEIWTWDSDAFGTTAANEDPDHNGIVFVQNLRFPGQYFDRESGLYYNYFRTYNPATGRYTQSDPIGLVGGLNTFLYANANPVGGIDPFGLWSTPGHEYYIDEAYPNIPERLRQAIKEGSKNADSFLNQLCARSGLHAMSCTPLVSADRAREQMRNWIKQNMEWFHNQYCRGNMYQAGFFLGRALHPIMDATSPAHRDFQNWDFSLSTIRRHGEFEGSLESLEVARQYRDLTVFLMRNYFDPNSYDCNCDPK